MNLHTQVLAEIHRALDADGLTLADLAARMGIAPEKLDAMLDDIEGWDAETLAKLAVVLDRDIAVRMLPVGNSLEVVKHRGIGFEWIA